MPRYPLRYSPHSTILNKNELIIYDHRINSVSWPEQHKLTFAAIHAINQVNWDEYGNASIAVQRRNQRASIQAKAHLIAETASHLSCEQQNEQGWRLNLEHRIVERFRSNIECKCKKRIWICDTEPPLDHYDKASTERIQQRRKERVICSCNQNVLVHNELGTPPLFFDFSGVGVLHDSISDSRKLKQPDRAFGLRNTNQLSQLLSIYNGGSPIPYSALINTASNNTKPPLVFPFLLLESKSEEGDGFSKIYEQSALPLQSFLRLQDQLQARTGVPKNLNKSLVWFLAHRGSDWKILAAYTYHEDGPAESVIVRVWEGDLTDKEKALQLLLAVDFIYDWARDIYRENLIAWLREARPETPRLVDYDIISQLSRGSRSSTVSNSAQSPFSLHERLVRTTNNTLSSLSFSEVPEKHTRHFLQFHISGNNAAILIEICRQLDSGWKLQSLNAILSMPCCVTQRTINQIRCRWRGQLDISSSDSFPLNRAVAEDSNPLYLTVLYVYNPSVFENTLCCITATHDGIRSLRQHFGQDEPREFDELEKSDDGIIWNVLQRFENECVRSVQPHAPAEFLKYPNKSRTAKIGSFQDTQDVPSVFFCMWYPISVLPEFGHPSWSYVPSSEPRKYLLSYFWSNCAIATNSSELICRLHIRKTEYKETTPLNMRETNYECATFYIAFPIPTTNSFAKINISPRIVEQLWQQGSTIYQCFRSDKYEQGYSDHDILKINDSDLQEILNWIEINP